MNTDFIKSEISRVFNLHGTDIEFVTSDPTSSFTLKGVRGHKRDNDLTDGMFQGKYKVRVLAFDWDTAYPNHAPQRGDQLTMDGKRHAVQEAHLVSFGAEGMMYVIIIQG